MSNDEKPPSVRIYQRVAAEVDPVSDLIGLIDIIELYLGIGTGEPSARARLARAADEIQRAGGVVDAASHQTILDVVEQLRKIEMLLADNGFETDDSVRKN